ncbi:MAG: GTPase HflX [Anaerolineales bacterium]
MGVQLREAAGLFTLKESLDELESLAITAGARVVAREVQRLDSPNPATYIGSGKLEEIKALKQELAADLVIFDEELSAAQLRNIERELDCTVLDRTALILDIFAMRASTREAALQVSLAQYAYRLPRLTRQWTHLSRQTVGGVGLRGPGETQLEIDRREIQKRMSQIREELEEVRQQRLLRRRRRERTGIAVVSLVGYTNAGKSTLLNALAGTHVLAEDRLFATLDPTTKQIALPDGKRVLLTDTVGFIQKLPTELVVSFRATLEEVKAADLLVHVADVSDPNVVEKVIAVEQVLQEIGAGDKPVVLALNKVDRVDPEALSAPSGERFNPVRPLLSRLEDRYPEPVLLSATQGVGLDGLLAAIGKALSANMVTIDTVVPYTLGDVVSLWHEHGAVDELTYGEQGIHVVGRLPRWLAGRLGLIRIDTDEEGDDEAIGAE